MFKQGIQWASQSQLHHQDLWRWAGRQETYQAGVTEAAQHHQLLERNKSEKKWCKGRIVEVNYRLEKSCVHKNPFSFSISGCQWYLSQESVDVKLRCMLVEYFHSNFFIFVDTSIDGPEATVPWKQNMSYHDVFHLVLLRHYERMKLLVFCFFLSRQAMTEITNRKGNNKDLWFYLVSFYQKWVVVIVIYQIKYYKNVCVWK